LRLIFIIATIFCLFNYKLFLALFEVSHGFYEPFYEVLVYFIIFLFLSAMFSFNRVLNAIFINFLLFVSIIAIYFITTMGIEVDGNMLKNALYTNSSEALELVDIYFYIYIVMAFIGLYLLNKKLIFVQKNLSLKRYLSFILIILLSAFGMFKLNRVALDEFIKHDTPKVVPAYIFPAISDYMITLERETEIKKKNISSEFELTQDLNNTIVVFVIGESARGDRFELNGYSKATNTNLLNQNSVVSIKNVTSCDTSTLNSIPCMMMRVKKSEYKQDIKESSFVEIYKDLGYETYWYSRNSDQKRIDNFCQEAKVCSYLYDLEYDHELMPSVETIVKQNKKALIVLHTMGSHINYNARVPQQHQKFKPLCESSVSNCTKEELDNSYDNSIYYTDIFLSELIESLKNKNAVVIYTSDHGESLGEDSYGIMKRYGHSTPYDIAPKEQIDVPLILWFSDKYLDKHKNLNLEKIRNLESISHDNIFYTLLGCGDISSQVDKNINKLNICEEE